MFGCNNDCLFLKYGLSLYTYREKGDYYYMYPNTAQGSFFPLQSYSKKTKRLKIQPKCALAPWASYNTP